MIQADFVLNKGFKWYSDDHISVKGFIFDRNDNYYEDEKLIDIIREIKTKQELLNFIKGAKGIFTIFIQLSNSEFLLVNDIIRSFPVFYFQKDNDIHLSDDINFLLKEIKSKKINPLSKIEFQSACFVSGRNTLIEDIYVTQSCEIAEYKNPKLEIESYYDYCIKESSKNSKEDLEIKSKQIIDDTFNRLIKSLNNRTAVIPLSGGLDSRLIACKLKEHHYEKVLCYTFGKPNDNQEKITSEKVAKRLGFDWVFIEYNTENIGDFIRTDLFIEYYKYCTQYSSSFMFQDYFAVKYLRDNKIIPDDAIFIPGYSGDFLGGSQLFKNGNIKYKATLNQIAQNIVNERYIHRKLLKSEKKQIHKKIETQLKKQYNKNNYFAYSIFENWEIKENLSKFIGHTAHIYDFFGYEYRLPYWDFDLVDFYKSVPYKFKFGKILYNNVLNYYFKAHHIDFKEGLSLTPVEFKLYNLKRKFKKFIPSFLIKKYSKSSDLLNYELILKDFRKEINENSDFKESNILTQNSYIAHWFLKHM